MSKGRIGGSMNGSMGVLSPRRAASRARWLARQEREWASKASPVTITYKSQTPEQIDANEKGLEQARNTLKSS